MSSVTTSKPDVPTDRHDTLVEPAERYDEWPASIPHDCEPETLERTTGAPPERNRLVGVDAARGAALIGMVAVHTLSPANADGDLSVAWALSSGKSSALFAVLAGVGLAFMSGRTEPPRGAAWRRASIAPIVRAVLLVLIGCLLGAITSPEDAKVILPYLGVMFLASIVLMPLDSRTLLTMGVVWALVGPITSHILRQTITTTAPVNLTLAHLVADPGDFLLLLLLTGFYPAMTWMAYICLGMGLGRATLHARGTIAKALAGGLALAATAHLLSVLLVGVVGVRERLATDVQGHMSLDSFTDLLVWGANGVYPADSPWWLAINAPHTATPLDLLFTGGIAIVVIGLFLAISHPFGHLLGVLAAPGSMTLTLYSLHLLLFGLLMDLPGMVHFVAQVLLLTAFALGWSRHFRRGPLEWFLWKVAKKLTPPRVPHAGSAR